MKSAYLRSWLILACFFITSSGWAQVRVITGKVISEEDGAPLSGVSVVLKGNNSGTQTNENGEFSINASPNDMLIISYTGYKQLDIQVGNSSTLDLAMKSNLGQLDDVVVVGYGTQKRNTISGSVSKLDQAVLQNAPIANIGSALQGTLPGLNVVNLTGQPGAAPNVLLRGGASINTPGGPLVVIDGIIRPYDDISADDIASVQILKDAAATAIYGARGNNGVLLITTKKGKSGTSDISYKFTNSHNVARKGYSFVGTKDYIYYNRLGNLNSGRSLNEVNSTQGIGLKTDPANLLTYDIRRFDDNTKHLLNMGWDTVGDPYGGTIIFKDHSGELAGLVYRNTQTQNHHLSASGGNAKGSYFSSFGYYKEDGIVVGSDYQRFTGDLTGTYKLKENLEITSGINLSTSMQNNPLDPLSTYWNVASPATYNPWLDSAKTIPNPGPGRNTGNPSYWLDKMIVKNEKNRMSGNTSLNWKINSHFTLTGTGSIYMFEQLNRSFQKATQTFAQMLSEPPSAGNLNRDAFSQYKRDFQQQYNAVLNYQNRFNSHGVNVMLGTEYFGVKSFGMQVFGTKAPTDDIPTLNASTIFNANTSTNPYEPNNNYSIESEYRIISSFGRLNYDYKQRYLFTAVFRRDGVSSLAETNRFGFFPGASLGWNVHRESFWQNNDNLSKYISTFKPRASYGINGNVAGLGNYEVQGEYNLQGLYNGNAGFLNAGIINSGLRWEKSKTLDIGAEIGLLDERILLTFDFYDRRTSDLLTQLSLPSYTGFNQIRTNLGTLQNVGYELSLDAKIIDNPQGVKLGVGANASFVKNKILQLPYNGQPNNRQGGMQIFDPKTNKVIWVGGYQEGQTLGHIYAYKQVSIFKNEQEVQAIAGNRIDVIGGISGPNSNYGFGKITPGDVNWLDVDKNDTIDSRDQVKIGNIFPKLTGGFNTTLSYKGFSMISRFQFAVGHTIYNDYVARVLGNYVGFYNYIDLVKNSWTTENTDTDIPKVYYADQVSAPLGKKNFTRSNNANRNLNSNNSRFYEKGDYLALRELTFSYDFSKELLSKTNVISRSRVYVSINNLFYITKFSGPTPEPPLTGINVGPYPTPKSFILGLQITF